MSEKEFTYNAIIDGYMLDMPERPVVRLVVGWLLLALSALVIGGLFSVLIVLSRTPYFQEVIPWVDFFHTALVVHVDMTVLVWFLGFAGLLWSLNSSKRCLGCGWSALILCTIGTLIIALAPFLGAGDPLMNNYVPVLQHPIFFFGMVLFGAGLAVLVINGLIFSHSVGLTICGDGALRFGLYTGLIAAMASVLVLIVSYMGMPEVASGAFYYELLFWDAGHTLQFVHIQLMLVAWLWMATVSGIGIKLSPRVALVIFALGLVPVLLTPLTYLVSDLGTVEHKHFVSLLMQYGGGLAALPIGLVIFSSFLNTGMRQVTMGPEFNALSSSMILFGLGGGVGYMISGSNVTVPAHYHGSIVAVTLAYMGLTYHLLPRLGFSRPIGKVATWQPLIYASGQLMHVVGLLVSGGYGVQRKTAGSEQGLDNIERVVGMGIMGLGGLIAVIGGIMFLVIVFKAMWPGKHAN